MAIDLQTRAVVWEAYEKARPKPGLPYKRWISVTSAELGISEKMVARVVAEENACYLAEVRNGSITEAQTIANMVGATATEAFRTLTKGLKACRKRPVLDKQGNVKLDLDGKPFMIVLEDWPSRLLAADKIMKVHGSFAPEQIEVTRKVSLLDMSADEAAQKMRELADRIQSFTADFTRQPASIAGNGTAARGIEGPQSVDGPVLLDDGMHQDEGRAGHGEPVQAVPKARLRKGTGRFATDAPGGPIIEISHNDVQLDR